MNHAASTSNTAPAQSAPKSGTTWVRASRAPRRQRSAAADALQLGAIRLASNRHA